MDYDANSITNDPWFQRLPPERKMAILRNAGIASPTVTGSLPPTTPGGIPPMTFTKGAAAAPTAMPTPMAAPTPSPAATPAPPPISPESPPVTKAIESFLGKAKEGVQSAQDTMLGTTGGAMFPLANMMPSSIPELAGDAAMAAFPMIAPEATGIKWFLGRLLAPAGIAAGTSYATGSKVPPGRAGVTTGIGSLLGEVVGAGQHAALGREGSPYIEQQYAKDLAQTSEALSSRMPEVVPDWLRTPANFLSHFTRPAKDLWGQFLIVADQLSKQAESFEKEAAASEDKGIKAHRTAMAKIAREAGDELVKKYNSLAKPFTALSKFFGKIRNFQTIGYKNLTFNVLDFQKWINDNSVMLRAAGIAQDAIDDVRRIIFGAEPGTPPHEIMTQTDTAPEPAAPGFRLHYYHATPRPITHINMPRAGTLAGNRQKAITLNPAWRAGVGAAAARAAYGLSSFEDTVPNAENTHYPPPNDDE